MSTRAERRRLATDELIDRVALEEMREAHGALELAPVAVVIAAYHEVENIGAVVEGMPSTIGGLSVSVVVVVDGEDDGTAAVVRAAGHVACIAPVNRGQGAALRLAYRIAREHGARYVVTADGDGQADPDDLEVVLAPVMDGSADFVTGSRRLGRSEAPTLARAVGVVVFGTMVSVLTGTRVTDTANPVRAMRADMTADLRLDEPQYQAGELLVSAIMGGYRVEERPVTMRGRTTGESKKGGTLSYGYRYGRVVLRTWWRERARRAAAPAGEVTTPAGTP